MALDDSASSFGGDAEAFSDLSVGELFGRHIDPEVTARCARGDPLGRQSVATGRDMSQRTPLPKGMMTETTLSKKSALLMVKVQSPTLFNPRPCLPRYVRQLRLAEAIARLEAENARLRG